MKIKEELTTEDITVCRARDATLKLPQPNSGSTPIRQARSNQ